MAFAFFSQVQYVIERVHSRLSIDKFSNWTDHRLH